jgi:hypothetical protein
MANSYEEDVRRLAKVIRTAYRLLGTPMASLEEATGLSEAAIHAIFDGTAKLEIVDVLRLAHGINVHPADFFDLAFPRRPVPRYSRVLLERGRAALGYPVAKAVEDELEGEGD